MQLLRQVAEVSLAETSEDIVQETVATAPDTVDTATAVTVATAAEGTVAVMDAEVMAAVAATESCRAHSPAHNTGARQSRFRYETLT